MIRTKAWVKLLNVKYDIFKSRWETKKKQCLPLEKVNQIITNFNPLDIIIDHDTVLEVSLTTNCLRLNYPNKIDYVNNFAVPIGKLIKGLCGVIEHEDDYTCIWTHCLDIIENIENEYDSDIDYI